MPEKVRNAVVMALVGLLIGAGGGSLVIPPACTPDGPLTAEAAAE